MQTTIVRHIINYVTLAYFKKQEVILVDAEQNHNISSDIIESNFGIYKEKKSPNKLYGITPFVLFIPLHAKLANESVTKTFNFKERIHKNFRLTSWLTCRLNKVFTALHRFTWFCDLGTISKCKY